MRALPNSLKAFDQATKLIPGGVNSPVRAFKSVGGTPPFIASGSGSHLVDIDGNTYLDFVCSWGPLILGHAHPAVLAAIADTARSGTSFGAPTLREIDMARLITAMVPSVEMVRLVNSGTEATMSAVRLARGFTKRNLIVKFAGCYHGHADSFLIAAGSGAITLGVPDSSGVTPETAGSTLVAEYNDLESVRRLFSAHGRKIAAVIVEPVAGNMGVVPPAEGFLQGLRQITREHDSLLIFDEVISGFRLAAGGAQEHFGVMPDLTTLGKIIGGGLPVGAYGGRADIMNLVAPAGPVYQAGTLSGNPLAVAAGIAALSTINNDKEFYRRLDRTSSALAEGIRNNCRKLGIKAVLNRAGSIMTLFFTDGAPVTDYASAKKSDTAAYARYFHACLDRGVYLAPSQFEALFVSDAHSDQDIEAAIRINFDALKSVC